jgi:hypothetical protein
MNIVSAVMWERLPAAMERTGIPLLLISRLEAAPTVLPSFAVFLRFFRLSQFFSRAAETMIRAA